MQLPDAGPEVYEFGEFALDATRCELRRAGEPAVVQPKVLRLLLHLVRHRDRIVSKDELLRALWPHETVSEGSIKRAVRGARMALGDSGEGQSVIRTARGFGYRFVLPVVARAADVAPEPAPRPQPDPPPSKSLAPPSLDEFVGRGEVMLALEHRLVRALSGAPSCVLLSGGPGVGKTRTAHELLQRARRLGADAWSGCCTDMEGAPAFWPLIQVFREAAADRGLAELRALMGHGAAEILAAMGELRREFPEVPEAIRLSSASSRFRVFDSVGVFLRRAAEQRPVVLGFDDLQSADDATLHLLLFIVRQLARTRLLIVGTYRREPPSQPLAAGPLAELVCDNRTHCIELGGWTEAEIAQYVRLATGAPPPERVSASLHAQTGGNPLFVRQMVESHHARLSDWEDSCAPALGGDLHGAIARHLLLVTDDCRGLLQLAAVCGAEFSVGLLSRLADVPLELVRDRLAEAHTSGLLQARRHPSGHYAFTHGLVRDALYHQLSSARRSELHGRIGRLLEAHGPEDGARRLAELTHHFILAAPAHDAGRALDYALRSAEAARDALAYERAASHYERALALMPFREPDPRLRLRLLFGRGHALARSGASAAARIALHDAFELASELGEVSGQVDAAALLASRPESGRVDEIQVNLLERAMRAVPETDDRRAWLQALLAKSFSYATDPSLRVVLARSALGRVRGFRDLGLRIDALTRCQEALLGPDQLEDRRSIAAELLELAHERGDASALLRAYAAQIETCAEVGDMAGVDLAVSSMDVLAEQVRDPFARWHVKLLRCMRATVRGELAQARAHAEDALSYGTPLDPELARRVYSVQLNLILRLTGRAAEADALMRAMALRYPTIPGWSASVGALDWALGRRDQARACLARLMEGLQEHMRQEPYLLSGLTAVSDLCFHVRDAAAAETIHRALLPYADHHGITHLSAVTYGPMTHYLGLLADCRRDSDLAEQHFEAALRSAENMRSPVFAISTRIAFARTLARSADAARRERAGDLLQGALASARRLQLTAAEEYCRSLARRYGVSLELQSTHSSGGDSSTGGASKGDVKYLDSDGHTVPGSGSVPSTK